MKIAALIPFVAAIIAVSVPSSAEEATDLNQRICKAWVRVDDAFEGTIMVIQKNGSGGPIGILVYVTDSMGAYGFESGETKIKGFVATAANEFECESLSKNENVGKIEWETMAVILKSENELNFRQKRGKDRPVGEWQRWVALDKSTSHYANFLYGRGIIAQNVKAWREATKFFEAAVHENDRSPTFLNGLAWRLAVNPEPGDRNPAKAIELARRACELSDYQDKGILDTLAAAYAAAGEFDRAVEYQKRACGALWNTPAEFSARLSLYRKQKGYVEGMALSTGDGLSDLEKAAGSAPR